MLKRLTLPLALAAFLLSGAAEAQSNPGLVFGQVPSAAQWNSYFSAKQNVIILGPSTVYGNPTAQNAAPSGLLLPACNSTFSALIWTPAIGFGCNNLSSAGLGNVTGPNGATIGYVPQYADIAGRQLSAGLPVATSGANTIVETGAGGIVLTSVIPVGKSVADPGTGVLEALLPIQTATGASKAFSTVDLQLETRRSNSGSAMTDGFPASGSQGMVNGAQITVNNFDATATDTISAGAGTTFTIGGSSAGSYAHPPGRSIRYVYDAPNTTWRATLNTSTELLAPNNLSDLLSASTARTNLGLGTAATVNTGTSGATIPLNNGNNTSSGNQTHSGTENFTGGIQIGGTAVTLPVPVAIGGTASANVSDALQTVSGVLNASACGKAQTPSWCAGSDVGAWVNSAISYAIAQGWIGGKIILDPTSSYNQSTQITKPEEVLLDCQSSKLIWQSTSGTAIAAGGTAGASIFNPGGFRDCFLQTAGGYTSGNTNIAIYSGGDPAGIINAVDARDANDIFDNVHISGFKTGYTHGNNSFSNTLKNITASNNYDAIYGVPVQTGLVTAFSISSNIVTVVVGNTFSAGDVINITGLSVGTYLNKVSLIVASQSGTQFTANFTHANISVTADSGTAYDGFYNSGEPSLIVGGSLSSNSNCAFDLNYTPDEWLAVGVHADYNSTHAVCGTSPNVDFTNSYAEQFNGPFFAHTSTGVMVLRWRGGQLTLTGTGTDADYADTTNSGDVISLRDVIFDSNHAVNYIVSTANSTSGSEVDAENITFASGSITPNNWSNIAGFFTRHLGGIYIPPTSAIPIQAETYTSIAAHLDAPSLPAGDDFCGLQVSYQRNISTNQNGCLSIHYHSGTGGDNTDRVELGMMGMLDIISADTSGNIALNGPVASKSSITLGTNGSQNGMVVLENGTASGASTTIQPNSVVTSAVVITGPSQTTEIMGAGPCIIASASSIDIGASCTPGQQVYITGTTAIGAFGSTAPIGSSWDIFFGGSLTVTNGATLNMSGGSSQTIVAAEGMRCSVSYIAAGTWYCSPPLLYNANLAVSSGGAVTSGSNIQGARFTVTGSTVPATGIYLPSANSLGFSTNSTAAGRVDASQRLLWGYTADQGGGELLQVNSGAFINGKVTATSVLDSGLAASSPVVSTDASKNLTTTAPTQTANTVYAGPTTGAAASPTFRALVAADLPAGSLPVLSGTTGSIGGSPLTAGSCSTGTVTVTGATTSMAIQVTPVTFPGAGFDWNRAYVSGTNTVTVQVCADLAGTPTASTYNVRVLQ